MKPYYLELHIHDQTDEGDKKYSTYKVRKENYSTTRSLRDRLISLGWELIDKNNDRAELKMPNSWRTPMVSTKPGTFVAVWRMRDEFNVEVIGVEKKVVIQREKNRFDKIEIQNITGDENTVADKLTAQFERWTPGMS